MEIKSVVPPEESEDVTLLHKTGRHWEDSKRQEEEIEQSQSTVGKKRISKVPGAVACNKAEEAQPKLTAEQKAAAFRGVHHEVHPRGEEEKGSQLAVCEGSIKRSLDTAGWRCQLNLLQSSGWCLSCRQDY